MFNLSIFISFNLCRYFDKTYKLLFVQLNTFHAIYLLKKIYIRLSKTKLKIQFLRLLYIYTRIHVCVCVLLNDYILLYAII